MEDQKFLLALKQSQSLVNKLLKDIPAAQKSYVSSESSSQPANLEFMVTSLAIPSAPVLKAISADFTLEKCLNCVMEGLRMHQDLLKALTGRVSNPEKLTDLQADIRDLLAQISTMQELGQMEHTGQYSGSGLAARLTGDYEVQVATRVVLDQLLKFTQDVFRSLRNISEVKPSEKQ